MTWDENYCVCRRCLTRATPQALGFSRQAAQVRLVVRARVFEHGERKVPAHASTGVEANLKESGEGGCQATLTSLQTGGEGTAYTLRRFRSALPNFLQIACLLRAFLHLMGELSVRWSAQCQRRTIPPSAMVWGAKCIRACRAEPVCRRSAAQDFSAPTRPTHTRRYPVSSALSLLASNSSAGSLTDY